MLLDSGGQGQSHHPNSDNVNEEEESTISLHSFTHTLLRSLDSCFNYVLFGIPRELVSLSESNTNESISSTRGVVTAEMESKKLLVARDNLFQFARLNVESSEPATSCKNSYSKLIIDETIHCKQEFNWDCGITCILMLVRYINTNANSSHQTIQAIERSSEQVSSSLHLERLQKQWMCDAINTTSVWTIDLIMLLDTILHDPPPRLRFPMCQSCSGETRVKYLYCSNNFGVDESYKCFNYYKNAYREDQKRVVKLFSEAQKKQIQMLNISRIDVEFVADLVSRENCIAIVLLDYGVLGKGFTENGEQNTNAMVNETEFSGHYVFLYGISRDTNDIETAQEERVSSKSDCSSYCFVILDPGSNHPFTLVTTEIFEKAWRACGTDSDIIFVTVDVSS